MRRYSESWATARNQSRRFIPPGGGTERNGTFASTFIKKLQKTSSDDRIFHKLWQYVLNPAHHRHGCLSVTEFMKLRQNERALKRLQPRNHSFAVAVPAKLIVIDLLAVFAKVVFDSLEKTIPGLETSQRKFPPLCSHCDCHCIITIRTLRSMPTGFFASRKSSSPLQAQQSI